MYLTLPISARDTWYQSAVRIPEPSRIHLPRFSWIWVGRREATTGGPVVYGEESKGDARRRSASCYLVSFAISVYILATDCQFCAERYCLVLNNARPLLPLETAFFETARAGKGFYPLIFGAFKTQLTFYSTRHCDLHKIRWSDDSGLWHWSRWWYQSSNCEGTTGEEFQKTIVRVCLSTACRCLLRRQVLVNLAPMYIPYDLTSSPMADLHSETGNHQEQVKVLSEKTASSLDDTTLKLLFVSVQQNNIDLCVRYAIDSYVMFNYCLWDLTILMTFFSLTEKIGVYSTVCRHHHYLKDCVRLNSIQEVLTRYTLTWFGHSYVSDSSIHWTWYSLRNRYEWVSAQNW